MARVTGPRSRPSRRRVALGRPFARSALSILGALLLYHVVTKGLSAYLADTNPEAALFLNGNNPTALVNLAEDKLAADPSFRLLDPVLAPPRNAGPGSVVVKGDQTTAKEAPRHFTYGADGPAHNSRRGLTCGNPEPCSTSDRK